MGGGTAGVTVAARLRRAGERDVAIVEPSVVHYYQPLWTLVGGGAADMRTTVRAEASVVPPGVAWIRDLAVELDPDAREVVTGGGTRIGYDALVVCPGVELAWDVVPGLAAAVRTPQVSTNYDPDLAPKTWEMVRGFQGGTALFTAPGSPIKCPGAPQKAAYLSCDYWRRQGTLGQVTPLFFTGMPKLFSIPEFAAVLDRVVARYGIDTRFAHELVEVDPGAREATFEVMRPEGKERVRIGYDLLHIAPPQRPPEFVRTSALADPASPFGWVLVNQHTLQHPHYPEVFSLGDVCSAPVSKTGAAVRAEAPVVVANIRAFLAGRAPGERYDGYAACPFTTARGKMLLAEFDYTGRPHPTLPLIDTQRERTDMWFVKKYGLPFFYWHIMLRGLG